MSKLLKVFATSFHTPEQPVEYRYSRGIGPYPAPRRSRSHG